LIRVTELRVPIDDLELAADRLWQAGAPAVEEFVEGDLGVARSVLAADDATSIARLGALPRGWVVRHFDRPTEPAETWRQFAAPIVVSPTLTIRPAWLPGPGVAIEPGASFGLGDHPTTRLTARAVERLVGPETSVLDVGCGSGVLAIVAALRGAAPVVAIDIAEAAREATVENAARNGVGDRIDVSTRPLGDVAGRFDVVLANILAPTLIALAPDLRRVLSPDGALVVSGILAEAHDHVLAALAPLRRVSTDQLDGWAAVELRA